MKLRVDKSNIPNAGLGLFAEEDVKRSQIILLVNGPRYTAEEVEGIQNENDYLLEINDGSGDCIEVLGDARYANDAKGVNGVPGMINNSQFCSFEDHSMYLEATRNIPKGSEILVNYGKAYWKDVKALSLVTV